MPSKLDLTLKTWIITKKQKNQRRVFRNLTVAKRNKRGAGAHISQYGFWGLLIFVMLPIPGTGVYAGTIATHMFRIPTKRAFTANVVGIFISCALVWSGTLVAVGKDIF